jgi:ArsR family transcriptional regulator
LLSHRFESARELYGDQWLGFSEVKLHQWLEDAGFGKLEVTVFGGTRLGRGIRRRTRTAPG